MSQNKQTAIMAILAGIMILGVFLITFQDAEDSIRCAEPVAEADREYCAAFLKQKD